MLDETIQAEERMDKTVPLMQFTLKERARLLVLRGRVQDAKLGDGPLADDLRAA